MGINITHTMNMSQFENRENLRNTAKNILNRQNASESAIKQIIDKTIFDVSASKDVSYNILSTSEQITLNNSLNETLKYLRSNLKKKVSKEPKFGELWSLVSKSEEDYNDLYDFDVDLSRNNIFVAA
jgi:hypothetical protein